MVGIFCLVVEALAREILVVGMFFLVAERVDVRLMRGGTR